MRKKPLKKRLSSSGKGVDTHRLLPTKYRVTDYNSVKTFANAWWRRNQDYLESTGWTRERWVANIKDEFRTAMGDGDMDPIKEARKKSGGLEKLNRQIEAFTRQSIFYREYGTDIVEEGAYFVESFLPDNFGEVAAGTNFRVPRGKEAKKKFFKENISYVSKEEREHLGLPSKTEAFFDKRTNTLYYSDVKYDENGYPIYVWKEVNMRFDWRV